MKVKFSKQEKKLMKNVTKYRRLAKEAQSLKKRASPDQRVQLEEIRQRYAAEREAAKADLAEFRAREELPTMKERVDKKEEEVPAMFMQPMVEKVEQDEPRKPIEDAEVTEFLTSVKK